ncbi:MAG: DUF1778 domain-containing protein [Propionibacteriaceae bacterium]|jgi:uncharacterized protein (DUF1778 family)|nr:DUF1778 domain-containing protein [Propionibacteriaceae bacterium]
MANTVTLSIKTTPAIKASIQAAAERVGLSVNSFVVMVAQNAANSEEIVIRNFDAREAALLAEAESFNSTHAASTDWDGLKAEYGL